ncbi:MAG TPA: hypothetical protein VF548_07605 [Allosphingosinicella sp.]|jgi:hypothetical protein
MSIKMIFASAAALAMAAGTPALAARNQGQQQLAASDSAGGDAGVQAKGERKICKFMDSTESRMKRERLCFTKAEWRKFEDAQQ